MLGLRGFLDECGLIEEGKRGVGEAETRKFQGEKRETRVEQGKQVEEYIDVEPDVGI